jgi:hypothetical protein
VAIVGMTNNTGAWPYDTFFTQVVDVLRRHRERQPPTDEPSSTPHRLGRPGPVL